MTADPSLISNLSWYSGATCPCLTVPLEGAPIKTPARPIPNVAAIGKLRTIEERATNLSDCTGVPPRARTSPERTTPIAPSRSAAAKKYMYNTTHFLDWSLIASILLAARRSSVSRVHQGGALVGRSRWLPFLVCLSLAQKSG